MILAATMNQYIFSASIDDLSKPLCFNRCYTLLSLLLSQLQHKHTLCHARVIFDLWQDAESCWKIKSSSYRSSNARIITWSSTSVCNMEFTLPVKIHSFPKPSALIQPQITDCAKLFAVKTSFLQRQTRIP